MDRIREKVPMVIVQTPWRDTVGVHPARNRSVHLLPNANLVEFTTGM